MRRVPLLLTLILASLLVAAPTASPPPAAAQLDPAIRDRVTASAIQVGVTVSWTEDGEESYFPMPVGSGTIVSASGWVLTNQHVVEPDGLDDLIASWQRQIVQDSPDVTLRRVEDDFVLLGSDGGSPPRRRYFADLVAADPDRDIAVLRIRDHADNERFGEPVTEPVPFVEFGDSNDVFLGDRVQIFAYPAIGGDSLTYTAGVISGFGFDDDTGERAWISTDAVMSGGSSGGTAINDAGQLIGIPTGGSRLDCREGDTNRDGVIDEQDVGCIPTGGSLGILIPINEAIALLERNDIRIAPDTAAAATQPDPTPTQTPVPTPPAPAQTPVRVWPTSVPTPPPGAGSATCDFTYDLPFEFTDPITPFDEADRYGYAKDALYLGIKNPGATIIYEFDECGTGDTPAMFNVSVKDTIGWGEVIVLIQTEDGAEWIFSVDPQSGMWSLYRTSVETGQFFYWIEPISYTGQTTAALSSMGVVATRDSVRLLINGEVVADSTQGILPEMSGGLTFGFGVGINPGSLSGSGQSFEASFRRVTLSTLP